MKKMILVVVALVALASREVGAGDVFREVDGVTYNATAADGWFVLHGKVLQSFKGAGVLVSGSAIQSKRADGFGYHDVFFAVKGLALIDDDRIPSGTLAKEVGVMDYKTVLGATKTIRVFDVGREVGAPEKRESLEAMLARTGREIRDRPALQKAESNRVAFAWQQATNGQASGEYDLGLRFLEGRGVEKDERQARIWLEKAAGKGHTYAKRALANLPPKEE